MTKEAKSVAELRDIAEDVLRTVAKMSAGEYAVVVGLSGDLGAGKTAFVKCVADILVVDETITSPTFILEKIYPLSKNKIFGERFLRLIHIDAYRLHAGHEMRALDWDAITRDPQNLIFIEWPEQVAEVMPKEIIPVHFEYVDEKTRTVTFSIPRAPLGE